MSVLDAVNVAGWIAAGCFVIVEPPPPPVCGFTDWPALPVNLHYPVRCDGIRFLDGLYDDATINEAWLACMALPPPKF